MKLDFCIPWPSTCQVYLGMAQRRDRDIISISFLICINISSSNHPEILYFSHQTFYINHTLEIQVFQIYSITGNLVN